MNLDFDTIEIPEEKLNRTIQNNIKKVHGIHRKQMIRHTAGLFCAAAFFFCLSAIFLHSNPSLAADLLHLFEKIENKQIFSGDLHTHATPLTNNNSQKSDGYTFTLSETYCDTQNFYVSVQITSEEGFPESQRAQVDPDGISSLYLMGKWTDSSFPENSYTQGVSLSGTFSDDHTFIGSFHQILGENTSKDTYNAEWKISGIQYSPEEAKNGNMYIYFSEPLEFQIETPVQSDGTVKKLLNEKLPNGTTLISATKTLTTISLESKGNEESKDNEEVEQSSTDTLLSPFEQYGYAVYDANGNHMTDKAGLIAIQDHDVSKIQICYFKLPVNPDQDVNNQPEYEEFQQSFREGGYSYDMIKDRIVKQVEIVFEE